MMRGSGFPHTTTAAMPYPYSRQSSLHSWPKNQVYWSGMEPISVKRSGLQAFPLAVFSRQGVWLSRSSLTTAISTNNQ